MRCGIHTDVTGFAADHTARSGNAPWAAEAGKIQTVAVLIVTRETLGSQHTGGIVVRVAVPTGAPLPEYRVVAGQTQGIMAIVALVNTQGLNDRGVLRVVRWIFQRAKTAGYGYHGKKDRYGNGSLFNFHKLTPSGYLF